MESTVIQKHQAYMAKNAGKYAAMIIEEHKHTSIMKAVIECFKKYQSLIEAFSNAGFTYCELATSCYMSGHKTLTNGNMAYLTIYQGIDGIKPFLQFSLLVQGRGIEKIHGQWSVYYSNDITDKSTSDDIKKLLEELPFRSKLKFDTSNIFSVKEEMKKYY